MQHRPLSVTHSRCHSELLIVMYDQTHVSHTTSQQGQQLCNTRAVSHQCKADECTNKERPSIYCLFILPGVSVLLLCVYYFIYNWTEWPSPRHDQSASRMSCQADQLLQQSRQLLYYQITAAVSIQCTVNTAENNIKYLRGFVRCPHSLANACAILM